MRNPAQMTAKGENMIFDTHAHYDAAQYDEDRKEVLVHLKDEGVLPCPCIELISEDKLALPRDCRHDCRRVRDTSMKTARPKFPF